MKDFFISFTGDDSAWADWIAFTLHEAGYDFHYQGWHFGPGSNFVAEMQVGAAETGRTLAVISPKYFESASCTAEWTAAFNRDKDGSKRLLIPIRVVKFDPPGMFGPRVYVDLHDTDEATAKTRLLNAMGWKPGPPAVRPQFPGAKAAVPTAAPRFPGAPTPHPAVLPAIWNVPHNRNSNFTGREDLLEKLHAALTAGEFQALTQAVHGLGGVGKTQTAVEYAFRYAGDYDAVLWVAAEDPAALAGNFAALAREIGLSVDYSDQPGVIAAVKRWLREHRRWLLVFDNAEKANDIKPFLPTAGAGHVVITSRNPDWRAVAKTLDVLSFTTDEAIQFLLARTGQDDPDAAGKLATEVGGLALVLEQVAAYVSANGISLAEYLRLFQLYREEVLSRDSSPEYPWTLETVWGISFADVNKSSPAAAELLNLLAFLAPDDIPLDMIRAGRERFPVTLSDAVSQEPSFREVIRALRCHSLVEVKDDTISIHRMVQAVTRQRVTADRKQWAEAAVGAVEAWLPGDPQEVLHWPRFFRLTPHASASADHCAEAGSGLERATLCLNQCALYSYGRADFNTAQILLQKALRIDEATFGPDHPNVAIRVNNLGSVLQEQGDFAGAKTNFERALRIDEATFGPDHPEVATDINNLGGVLKEQGHLVGARAHYGRALRISEAVFGPDHPNVAKTINNLGSVLREQGDFAGARCHFERALRINEAAFGPDHPNVASAINNLGSVIQDQGELAEARSHFERALRINEAAFGPDHPNVASAINNLGSVLKEQGELTGARCHFERALRINEAAFGSDHPNVARAINNLGSILQEQGDIEEAKAHFERALRIIEAAFGPDHPNIANAINNLGVVLENQGDFAGARSHFERALRINEAAFGSDHPNVARAINNLGSILQEQGDIEEAKAHFERALRITEAAFGPDHPSVAIRVNNLGNILQILGDLVTARENFERALSINEAAFGPEHPNVTTCANNLGRVLQDLGDLAGARNYFERALEILRRFLGEEHPTTQIVRGNLEHVLRELDNQNSE